jgi:hypothetical protein
MAVTLVALYGEGDRMVSIIKVTGPTSYTAITPGTPPAGPTGGQDVPATAFGLKFINFVELGLDQSGTYNVLAVPNIPSSAGAATKVTLMWTTANGGAEVSGATNLSTFTVRLMAIGR